MLVGGGRLGGAVLDLLATNYPEHEYVLAGRNTDQLRKRANLSRYIAAQWGHFPHIRVEHVDLMNTERTSAVLAATSPDLIFNATTPFPWWRIPDLRDDSSQVAELAGSGVWCALDCLLPAMLSRAIEGSQTSPVYVNGCYPDMVNAFLAGAEGAPSVGIGNISNLIPGLRLAFAEMRECDGATVDIRLVAHHYTSLNAPTIGGCGGAPYALSVGSGGEWSSFRAPDDTPFAALRTRFERVRGVDGQAVTISSAATVLASFLKSERRLHHGPGPLGLPGGYPFETQEDGTVSLALPPGLSREQAVGINELAQSYDGIETVKAGTVSATEEARAAHRKIVGMDLPTVTTDMLVPLARETIELLNARHDLGLSL